MERDAEIGRRESEAGAEAWRSDGEPLDLSHLPPCPGIPYTDEEIAEADARAEADIAAGRVYPNAIVGEWLLTWGKPDQKPFKEWLAARNG